MLAATSATNVPFDLFIFFFFLIKKMPGVDAGSRSHVCDDGALERLRVTYRLQVKKK
jgi:hypothetical protein